MYTDEEKNKAFELVCVEIEKGRSLRKILKGDDAPISSTVFYELLKDKAKNERYARACEVRADEIFDEIIEIADESNADIIIREGMPIVVGEAVQRSKLKVDARKWVLAKMQPKKYGDKLDIDHTVRQEQPLFGNE